jgi:hypothetical protein
MRHFVIIPYFPVTKGLTMCNTRLCILTCLLVIVASIYGGFVLPTLVILALGMPLLLWCAWKDFFEKERFIIFSVESRSVILKYFAKRSKVIGIDDIEVPYISVHVGNNEKLPFVSFSLHIPHRRGPKIIFDLAAIEMNFAQPKPLSMRDEAKLDELISQARQITQFMRLKSTEDQPTALELRYSVKVCLELSNPE